LVLLGVAGVSARIRLVALGVAAVSLVVPVVVEALTANLYGFWWQGRYTLPLAVGLPMLLAAPAGSVVPPALAARLVPGFAGLAAVGQFLSLWVVLVRFVSGSAHPLNPLSGPWTPPGGAVTVLALGLAGCAFWALALARASRHVAAE